MWISPTHSRRWSTLKTMVRWRFCDYPTIFKTIHQMISAKKLLTGRTYIFWIAWRLPVGVNRHRGSPQIDYVVTADLTARSTVISVEEWSI